jgi:lipopolysaccharide transport system ATP-binding protein
MAPPIIQISNVGKSYRLGRQDMKHAMFRDAILGVFRAPFNALKRTRNSGQDDDLFWALKNVSIDINQGEVVGIIGRNGAGKSTLLKVLSRITEPTIGTITLRGRVASLLEVGTGFHPELTGRENVYLNGAILGMSRLEITRKFDDIVAFAEIEKFLDTAVKYYSSGMYVRLAFAVAAHLEPEILIVDEVLAVGDAAFQKKCLGKMGEVSKAEGRTILFVSHNMSAMRQLTSRCILLSKGGVAFDGDPGPAIELYAETSSSAFVPDSDLTNWPRYSSELGREVEFKSLKFDRYQPIFDSEESIVLEVLARANETIEKFRISGTIVHLDGSPVGNFFGDDVCSIRAGEEKTFSVRLKPPLLAPGRYLFWLALGRGNEVTGHRDFDIVVDVLPFEISALKGDGGAIGTWAPTWGHIRFPDPVISDISAAKSVYRA